MPISLPVAEQSTPFETLQFRYPWRAYQERVLDAIDRHLNDRRLHIVAAPGAGKTTLGLEVFRRLGKRGLVLAPTRVIRDQWIQRLEDFCTTKDPFLLPWVSRSLSAPRIFTAVTYQALHARFFEDAEVQDEFEPDSEQAVAWEEERIDEQELGCFIEQIRAHDIQVLILDEAHHLRSEWWRALDKVCSALPHLTLVSLTATPPYDAEGNEWTRYEHLCGPIDEEISVPELVKAGTLCPHQDFVWAVDVSPSEKARIEEHDRRVSMLCHALLVDSVFNRMVMEHPWVAADVVEDQDVLAQPRVAIALLVFLKARAHPLPAGLRALLDLELQDIPELGRHWWQVLIEALLFSPTFKLDAEGKAYVDQLRKQLRSTELLRNKELSLERHRRLERSLSLSASKIKACVSIHRLEYKHRKESLRQVVLTDFIRDDNLLSVRDIGEVNLGAWPVFAGLVSASAIPERIGLLSGRVSVVHATQLEYLLALVERDRFSWSEIGDKTGFLKVSGPLNQLTSAFTTLLMQGRINTLVGTRSLLGEGWDAPAINSLVLASAVGSFMLTNQMRGRAIRIDKNAPDKISSIWHIVAVDTKSYSGLSDYSDLRRRFETFVGLSEKEKSIENGFDRMAAFGLSLLVDQSRSDMAVSTNNLQMIRRYWKRAKLAERWQEALVLNDAAQVRPTFTAPAEPGIRAYHLRNSLKHLLTVLWLSATSALFYVLAYTRVDPAMLFLLIGSVALGTLIWRLPTTLAVLKILWRHLPVDGSLKQIGLAVSSALCEAGLIQTPIRNTSVEVRPAIDGTFYVALSGATFYESSLFADCLGEVLSPIDSPRYMVVRAGAFLGRKRDDYHAVPFVLAARKSLAQLFHRAWCRYVGPGELIYTRDPDGRRHMLKAKMRAFSAVFSKQVRRQDRWQ